MRRTEILVVLLLLALTAVAMGRAPRLNVTAETVVPAVAATASGNTPTTEPAAATLSPSATATPTPSVTPSPTVTATPTATAAATATAMPSPTAEPTFAFDTRPDLDRYMYVDQMTQRMYVFERGELIRDMPCSTGLPEDTTYTEAWEGPVGRYYGTFYSFGVWADEAWYLYPSLGNILVHSLPYLWHNGYKVYLERDALGVRPASHGCIRLAPEDAAWLTAYNPEGALMTITDPYREHWRAVLSESLGADG